MKYIGGKDKYASNLVTAMSQVVPGLDTIYEPFCGGLSVTGVLVSRGVRVYASDFNDSLISLYKHVLDGWIPPDSVSYEDYLQAIRGDHMNPMFAFVNLTCTFNGTWLGKYQPLVAGRPDYVKNCRASLLAIKSWYDDNLLSLSAKHYLAVSIPDGAVVYMDPPYEKVSNVYGVGKFDNIRFWHYCESLARRGCHVFISEYKSPIGKEVWSDARYSRWCSGKVERLFYVH